MKIKFNVKNGENVINIPATVEVPAGTGLSNLYDKTFTIINQIPSSQTVATKIAWVKHTVEHCDKADGIFDKSTGNMVYKANTFTRLEKLPRTEFLRKRVLFFIQHRKRIVYCRSGGFGNISGD